MRIFLIIPFQKEFEDISLLVKDTIQSLGHTLIRADEIFGTGIITEQIQAEIKKADLVIADISKSNPNVMFELGFAQSSTIPILPICQRGDNIPFDVASGLIK